MRVARDFGGLRRPPPGGVAAGRVVRDTSRRASRTSRIVSAALVIPSARSSASSLVRFVSRRAFARAVCAPERRSAAAARRGRRISLPSPRARVGRHDGEYPRRDVSEASGQALRAQDHPRDGRGALLARVQVHRLGEPGVPGHLGALRGRVPASARGHLLRARLHLQLAEPPLHANLLPL